MAMSDRSDDASRSGAKLPSLILPGLPAKVGQITASRDLDLIVASTVTN